jgi:hypothetical protein
MELPPLLVGVHDVFHMSQLEKFLKAPMDVVSSEVVPLEADLKYPKHPIKILDQKSREAQDDQVLQDSMDKSYCRRSNMGKRGIPPFSLSKI